MNLEINKNNDCNNINKTSEMLKLKKTDKRVFSFFNRMKFQFLTEVREHDKDYFVAIKTGYGAFLSILVQGDVYSLVHNPFGSWQEHYDKCSFEDLAILESVLECMCGINDGEFVALRLHRIKQIFREVENYNSKRIFASDLYKIIKGEKEK